MKRLTKFPTRPLVLAVLAIGVLFTGIGVLDLRRRGLPVPWRSAAWQEAGNWLFAAFVPAVVRFSRRFPVEGGWKLARLPLHALAAVAISVGGTAVYATIRLAAKALWGEPFSPANLVAGYLRGSLVLDLTVYLGLAGAVHASLYYERLLAERLAASRLEAELAASRLRLLRVQLNPHFLFNLLNMAAALVYEEPQTVDRLMSRLSLFLRRVLAASEPDELPLEEELEIAGLYADLQRLRFGEDLLVRFEVDEAAAGAAVPSLLLQPLLENALVHGRDPGRPLRVSVRASREGGHLLLEVEDDGRGLAAGTAPAEGVGLGGARARLALLYGDDQRLEIGGGRAGGARVSLRLPFSRWSCRAPARA